MKKKFFLIITYLILLLVFVTTTSSAQIIFQRPFGIAIDDLGWNEGESLGDEEGPWRVGIRRDFDVRDYRPIVEVGKKVGARFMGLFILGEMDRLNVVKQTPTITKAGSAFSNTSNIDSSQFEVMNYVKKNAAHLEFGIHGVGHEHWVDGQRKRAEWYNLEDNEPWPESDNRAHIRAFKQIMSQYGLSPENGHSFPESFVPCAYGFYWNPDGEFSTGKLMDENGVKYANTDFSHIQELNPPKATTGGFDHGVLVIDRLNYGNPWYEIASLPTASIDSMDTDVIETHWANWLAQDDFLQKEVTRKWVNFFRRVQKHPEFYVAKNTEQLYSQWLYKRYTKVEETQYGQVTIDNRDMPSTVYENDMLGNMVLSVKLRDGQHVQEAKINGKSIPAYFEEAGFGFMYLPMLGKENYELNYELGDEQLGFFVENEGTYNVYSAEESADKVTIDVEVYGTQTIKIHLPGSSEFNKVSSESDELFVKKISSTRDGRMLSVVVEATDLQGSRGRLLIK